MDSGRYFAGFSISALSRILEKRFSSSPHCNGTYYNLLNFQPFSSVPLFNQTIIP
jgi:hypothetical protein